MYKVNIDFRGAASFSAEVVAANETDAKFFALAQARACGWTEAVVKFTATPTSALSPAVA